MISIVRAGGIEVLLYPLVRAGSSLPVPDGPWLHVIMHMEFDLPVTRMKEDGNGAYDSIWVFFYHFTKAAHLALCCKTCIAGTVANAPVSKRSPFA